jgi:TonB-dependent starch-binding outer membrane protein SusC
MKKSQMLWGYLKIIYSLKFLKFIRNILIILFLTICQVYAEDSNSQNTGLNQNQNELTAENSLNAIEGQSVSVPQPRTISGQITDESGVAYPGVYITIKGTTRGSMTDVEGNYSIEVDNPEAILVFSFVGTQTQEIIVGSQTEINVTMTTEAAQLRDIVVVGYGTMNRYDVTGSVSSVSSSDLDESSITTAEDALMGRMSGVDVTTMSHEPGGGITVNIRGTNSITAGGTPLYVIDGMPIATAVRTGESSGVGTYGSVPSPLSEIDPSMIESIDVLKDASATAIYGSRAANGVVLITTKSGKAGSQNIDFSTSLSISNVAKKLDFMSAEEWAIQANESFTLRGQAAPFASTNLGAGTDWQDVIFRQAIKQEYNLAFSGGTETLRYSVSGAHLNEDGIIRGSNFKRYGTSIRIDANPNDRLTVSGSINLSYSDNGKLRTDTKGYGQVEGIMSVLFEAPPTSPAREDDGTISDLTAYPMGGGLTNPLIMTDKYKQNIGTLRSINSFSVNYALTDALKIEGRLGADLRDWKMQQYYPIGSEAGGSGGSAEVEDERNTNVLGEGLITYNKDLGENHRVSAVGGMTYQQEVTKSLGASSRGFPSDYFTYNNLGLATSPGAPRSGFNKWQLVSYFGRVNYTFRDKYLLKVSGRYDGSSKFGANNKFGFFPAVAVGWQLGREPFIEQLGLFSMLKLRVSYGQTGNESIGTYRSLARVSTGVGNRSAVYWNGSQNPYARPGGVPNPDLSWEKAAETNFGVDMGFFDQRLQLFVNYFNKETTDLLMNVPIPRETGFGSVLKNTGAMSNKGLELEVFSRNLVGEINWSTTFNISFLKNEVLSLAGAGQIWSGWVGGGNVSTHNKNTILIVEGRSIGQWYGSTYLGTWKSQAEIDAVGTMPGALPGEPRYADLNGDGNYDADSDDTWIGDPNPKATWGLSNTVSYKRFNLDLFIYGKYDFDVLNISQEFHTMNGLGVSRARLDRWSPTNPDSDIPAAYAPIPTRVSTLWVEDGTFIRVQNLTLSYNLPVENLAWIRSLRIGVAADNLLTISDYTGYDPESNARGSSSGSNTTKYMDLFSYPSARGFRFELKVGF